MNLRWMCVVSAVAALSASCVISIGGAGCGMHAVHGSGVRTTEHRDVEPFSRVVLTGSTDLKARIGSPQSLRVTGDDNVVPHIRTRVKDGVLEVDTEPGGYSYSTKAKLLVEITVPRIDSVSVRGSADVDVAGLNQERFDVDIAGSGDVKGEGQVERVSAAISGSGDVHFFHLKAKDAAVRISGSGDIEVYATGKLDVDIDGSGDVRHKGGAAVKTSIDGSGDVSRAD